MRIEGTGGVGGSYDPSARVRKLLEEALKLIEQMNAYQAKHEFSGKFDSNMWNTVRPKITELLEEAWALYPPGSPVAKTIQKAINDFGALPRDFGVGKAAGVLNETDQDITKILNSLH